MLISPPRSQISNHRKHNGYKGARDITDMEAPTGMWPTSLFPASMKRIPRALPSHPWAQTQEAFSTSDSRQNKHTQAEIKVTACWKKTFFSKVNQGHPIQRVTVVAFEKLWRTFVSDSRGQFPPGPALCPQSWRRGPYLVWGDGAFVYTHKVKFTHWPDLITKQPRRRALACAFCRLSVACPSYSWGRSRSPWICLWGPKLAWLTTLTWSTTGTFNSPPRPPKSLLLQTDKRCP